MLACKAGPVNMATSEPAMARDSAETGRFRPLFLLALCVALPMVLFDTIDGVNFLGDIDDQLRPSRSDCWSRADPGSTGPFR
jgi:hypothetical protein